MKIKLTTLIFSLIFILGSFYRQTPLQFLLGFNDQLSLICIFIATIIWFLFTESSVYLKIINSRYIFLIIVLMINFLMIRSSYSLRELGTLLALLPIIFSKRVGIKNIINIIVILNVIFLLLTSFIEGLNYLGFLDLDSWDVRNLAWISEESPVYNRQLRPGVCFFNPYFISFMEYIGTRYDCLDVEVRQINFFWIEPTGVLYSSSFLLLSYATGLFKSLRLNLSFLFFINFLSRTATGVGSLIIILILRFFSKISIFRIPRILKYILGLSLIPLTIIILLKLIENYYPEKAETSLVIFFVIKNFFSNLSLFGNKDLVLAGALKYNETLSFGASAIPIRYGILGFVAWIITYLPFFIRSFVFVGFSNTRDFRALFAYCSLLISSIMILRQNTLFTPFIILIGEYVQMKYPIEKQK